MKLTSIFSATLSDAAAALWRTTAQAGAVCVVGVGWPVAQLTAAAEPASWIGLEDAAAESARARLQTGVPPSFPPLMEGDRIERGTSAGTRTAGMGETYSAGKRPRVSAT